MAYRLQLGMSYLEIATKLAVEPSSVSRWVSTAISAANVDKNNLSVDDLRLVLSLLYDGKRTGRPRRNPDEGETSKKVRDDTS